MRDTNKIVGHNHATSEVESNASCGKKRVSMGLWGVIVALMLVGFASMNPVWADTYPRVVGVDVEEYVFRVSVTDESNVIRGLTTIAVQFSEAGVGEFPLDLIEVAPDHNTGMKVSGIWIADELAAQAVMAARLAVTVRGVAANYTHEDDRLKVALPKPSKDGQRSFVTVEYSGIPATGLEIGETKYGDRSFFSENWPNRARHWLPTVDHPYDKARSQMVVTAPNHYQVISNGLLVEESDLGDGTRLTHWRQAVPIATWLNVVGIAEFAVQSLADFDGKPIQTWVYPQDREAGFFDFAVPTHDVLAYYSEYVGPYAYEKLANVQTNSVGGGMESASAIFYDDDAVTGTRNVGWRNVIIHEIAHHWFGNAVTESDWDDVWLSEGITTYFTLLFREHAYGRDDFLKGLRNSRAQVFRFYERNPDYRIVHDELADMSKVTTGMQYQKGAWTMHMLRGYVGNETFWEGMRKYYARYFNGNASTADFRRVIEEVSGKQLEWFFDQWLRQGGLPSIAGTWVHEDGEVQLALRQTQGTYQFRLPMEVELRFEDGSVRRELIDMNTAEQDFVFSAVKSPSSVVLDPDEWVLLKAEISREEP